MTFYPATTGAKVIVDFSEFNIESNYDYLYIYDGISTSATQIGQYSGTTGPGTVTATNDEGALTFRFTSDYSVNKSGWVATVSCEIPSFVQTFELGAGWNWWSPNVDITLSQLKEALGTHGLRIAAQDGKFATYNANSGTWSGNLQSIELGKMYKIKTNEACSITFSGEMANPSDYPITIYPGNNWIGFFGTESMSVNQAMSNFTPTQGDKIIFNNRFSTYNGSSWVGTLSQLVPGNGYTYKSNATESQTLIFNSAK